MATAQLTHVSKYFNETQVLTDINLEMKDGEFITFVGPSGSGKSTLLRVISGLEPVTCGQVRINSQDVTQKSPRERNISMVFQNYALYPHMTVAKNITFGMRMRKESKAAQAEALAQVVSMLQLEGLLDRPPRQLSGGQRQRVAMARAIVRTPDLFLMDEPLSNLDAKLRNEVRLSIMELHKKLSCTMVYVTHDQIEAMTMAHRIVVLDKGVIQQIGTPQELYHRPANIFTAGFMGTPAMNFIPLTHSDNQLTLGDGKPLIMAPGLEKKRGQAEAITLGLRPEHIFPSYTDCLAAAPEQTPVPLTTTIVSWEMLGSEFLIHTRKDDLTLRYCLKNNGQTPKQGEQIKVFFPLSKAHFFDTARGNRLN